MEMVDGGWGLAMGSGLVLPTAVLVAVVACSVLAVALALEARVRSPRQGRAWRPWLAAPLPLGLAGAALVLAIAQGRFSAIAEWWRVVAVLLLFAGLASVAVASLARVRRARARVGLAVGVVGAALATLESALLLLTPVPRIDPERVALVHLGRRTAVVLDGGGRWFPEVLVEGSSLGPQTVPISSDLPWVGYRGTLRIVVGRAIAPPALALRPGDRLEYAMRQSSSTRIGFLSDPAQAFWHRDLIVQGADEREGLDIVHLSVVDSRADGHGGSRVESCAVELIPFDEVWLVRAGDQPCASLGLSRAPVLAFSSSVDAPSALLPACATALERAEGRPPALDRCSSSVPSTGSIPVLQVLTGLMSAGLVAWGPGENVEAELRHRCDATTCERAPGAL